jgi:hypothetical protein
MNRFTLVLLFLTLCAVPPGGWPQAPDQPEASGQNQSSGTSARRPKMPAVITFESSVGNVTFPHRVHQKMGCQKCHHQIHAKDLITPHPAYLTYSWINCRECHDESENQSTYYGCGKCHHSNLANIADETLNAKVVVHKSCWKCHLSGTGAHASARCGFCHVKDEQPLEASHTGAGADGASASAGNSDTE